MKQISLSVKLTLLLFLFVLVGCNQSTQETTGAEAKAETTSEQSDFPKKPINWVVPFGPGSVTDLSTRLIAEEMSKKLGVPIVVDNLPGGATVLGHVKVAQSKADGYTVGTGALAVEITLAQTEAAISGLEDLDVLAQMGEYINAISVSADSEWKTLEELGNWAAENQGELVVTPSGTGGITHLWWDLVAEHFGAEDYGLLSATGGNDAMLRLLSGDSDVVVTPLNDAKEHVEAGNVRILALTTSDRVEQVEDIPTISEFGVENSLIHNYLFIAPNGLPEDVREILLSTLEGVLADTEVKSKLEQLMMNNVFLKEEELKKQNEKGKETIETIMEDRTE
ncbi:tripartite tricarboxylate transporter substrate binding protein [Halalkalibacter krulwichiae]|nr:tripartite tricarboxylate transporter substrate binding protein [Halalkalibacter krulwichiae]